MPGSRFFVLITGLLLVTGAAGTQAEGGASRAEIFRQARELTVVGRMLFFEPALSASGRMSCASCHDPAHAYGPANGLAVQLGGKDLRASGRRAVPSLRYRQTTPQFTEHYFESEDEGDPSVDNGPTGGLMWDGRVDRGRDQARLPLLSPYEMANAGPDAVVAALRRTHAAGGLRRIFGKGLFGDPVRAFAALTEALEAFEESYSDFYPYSSKYDAYLAGTAALTPAEARGLALFNDPDKGNCAHCHPSARGGDGTPPQFTDNGFVALGVPRNPEIPANADPAYFDLGLCGPLRSDFRDRAEYCGLFKAPSLRNVAVRRSFFHNGVFHDLREAVEFYAERDTDPAKWYPRGSDGKLLKFDDLPERYRANVNAEPPFGGKPGGKPAFSGGEIDDIVAFLATLTDGYRP